MANPAVPCGWGCGKLVATGQPKAEHEEECSHREVRVGLGWDRLGWVGVGLGWVGLRWVGLGWVELDCCRFWVDKGYKYPPARVPQRELQCTTSGVREAGGDGSSKDRARGRTPPPRDDLLR